MNAQWLGLVRYTDSLEIQKQHIQSLMTLFEDDTRSGHSGVVLGLEHPSVITLGKRAQSDRKDILWSDEKLKSLGVEVFSADRGGLATLHSPGQLVVYPILSLKKLNLSVRDYVGALERATIQTLKEFGVEASTIEGCPGVFVGLDKIASIGVRVANRVTSHGIAIHIANDLELFGGIQACGKTSRVTSLKKLLKNSLSSPSTEEFFQRWLREFMHAVNR